STRSGGTGLGLAIVQRLVESMDGVMAFKTKTGEGSTFTIFLKSSLPENTKNALFIEEDETEPADIASPI
ncbi:MAG: hypothetical protein GY855_02810, partial [candidate division Zixibacteria bacterium]|nr:hypothetical protein [candidate division Zixibacteria bacterium]